MPQNAEQVKISLIRSPSREACVELAASIRRIIADKDLDSDDEYSTKLMTEKKTIDRLKSQLSTLDNKWISALDGNVSTEEYRLEYKEMVRYSKILDECEAKIELELHAGSTSSEKATSVSHETILRDFTKILEQTVNRGNGTLNDSNMEDVLSRIATVQEQQSHHLPVLDLKKFDGDITYFYAWWDEFKVNVHDRPHMSNGQKFSYLRNLLEGPARSTLDNIQLTGANYIGAVNYLMERYGNIETIAIEIVTQLMELERLDKTDGVQLRKFLDKVQNHVIALRSMNLDEQNYSTILYPIILRKIPSQLSLRFIGQVEDKKQKRETTDVLNEPERQSVNLAATFAQRFKSLLEFLKKEVDSREQVGTIVYGSSGSKPASARNLKLHTDTNGVRNSSKKSFVERNVTTSQNVATAQYSEIVCPICQGKHPPSRCKDSMPVESKINRLRKKKYCTTCLKQGHEPEACTAVLKCFICKGGHHKVLCTNSVTTLSALLERGETMLPSGHVKVVTDSKQIWARFLLDSGAERTFVSSECVDQLNLKTLGTETFYLHSFGAAPRLVKCRVVEIELETREGQRLGFSALVIPRITTKNAPFLSANVRKMLKDPAERFGGPEAFDILFNAKDSFRLIRGINEISDELFVIETAFGELIVGDSNAKGSVPGRMSLLVNLEKFWDLEHIGILPSELQNVSKVSNEFTDNFMKSISFDGRMYSTVLSLDPTKIEHLADNQRTARKQAESLLQSFKGKVDLGKEYAAQIAEFFENAFAEAIPPGEVPKYFMPHFPVVNEAKKSYKVRPVFNASSKMKGQLSLNDVILDVPNLLPTSVEILLRFRVHNVGLIGDITKAYMTVGIEPQFRNYLCFFWSPTLNPKDLSVFRMNRNCFGVKDAQFNTIAVIRHHASRYEQTRPVAAKAIREDLYMDDLVTGSESLAAAEELKKNIFEILGHAGMIMRKWRFTGKAEAGGDELILGSQTPEKVLGIVWNNVSDVLTFRSQDLKDFVKAARPCKRTLMGAVARLHDPAGFVSPYVMKLKLLLQKTHLLKLPLDGILPKELLDEWNRWCEDLQHIDSVKIPRCYAVNFGKARVLELHAFADASDDAYAAVVYLKTQLDSVPKPVIALVISKARLTPIKSLRTLTIPKKELVAAMCAARLVHATKKFLNLDCKTYYWTDSLNVFYRIRSESPLKYDIFVRNRLVEILKLSSAKSWFHVAGKLNPADLPSRGQTMQKLLSDKVWFEGPNFLKTNDYEIREPNADQISVAVAMSSSIVHLEPLVDIERHSRLRKAVRVTATVIRAVARFKFLRALAGRKTRKARQSALSDISVLDQVVSAESLEAQPLTALDLELAKHRLIWECQFRCFREVFLRRDPGEDSRLTGFGAFFDEKQLLRVGGRLHSSEEEDGVKHPLLIAEDHFTTLVIRDIHEQRVAHLRTDIVLSHLRQDFWLMQARRIVKKLLNSCIICRRFTAKPGAEVEAPLPGPRTEKGGVFRNVGVDYLGPFGIQGSKVWIALFTCSVTRALHLEVVQDLSAEAFLDALKRFVATRGVPTRIISDNGLNFVRAAKALVALWNNLSSESLQEFMGSRKISWKFNVPRAAWWGGLFERLVRVVKDCLKKTSGLREQPLFRFMTLVKEIEAIINSRPLTNLPTSPLDCEALTPGHFLMTNPRLSLPPGSIKVQGVREDELVRLWRARESILDDFWVRWRNEYMLFLRSAHRIRNEKSNPLKVGDIVLIHEENLSRSMWRLGRVEELIEGKDGKSRACRVRTSYVTLVRSCQHLYKLM